MPDRPRQSRTGCRWLVAAALSLVALPFCLWLLALFPIWAVFLEDTGPVYCAAFSPDGSRILAAHDKDDSLRLWDVKTGRELRRLGQGRVDGVQSVAFSPDGHCAVSTANTRADYSLRLWDVETGQELRRLPGHTGFVTSVVFSPDGRQILSGGKDRTLRLWDAQSGEEIRRLVGHEGGVNGVAFCPDGRHAVSGAGEFERGGVRDPTVRLWDLRTGKALRILGAAGSVVTSVCCSPDGRLAASGDLGGAVRLWDTGSGQEVRRLPPRSARVRDEVNSVAFSPDGRYLVAGTDSGAVRLWDKDTGEEVRRFIGHTQRVWCVAFSPDGRCVLSASGTWDDLGYKVAGRRVGPWKQIDCTIRVWDPASGKELRRLGDDSPE